MEAWKKRLLRASAMGLSVGFYRSTHLTSSTVKGLLAQRQSPNANKRKPDIASWFSGLRVETLDFYFGPDEHDSYLSW